MTKTSRQTEPTVRARTTSSTTSLATIGHKTAARSTVASSTAAIPKNRNADTTQSSGFASDISVDENDEMSEQSENTARASLVHNFALKTSPNEYKCNLCEKIIRCGAQTNSNIRRHLANVHGKAELSCKSQRSSIGFRIAPKKKKELDEAAMRCISTDARPFGDYRRPGMQSFLNIAVPGYYGPSRRTVERNLSKLYAKKQRELKAELAKLSDISLTADLWRSARNRCFLCITSHHISPTTNESCGKVLSFRHFHGRHLGLRIRSHMIRVLKQFELVGKITATTTDNGSDVKKATGLLKIFGVRFHCLAHGLNLIVHKALGLWPKKQTKEADASSDPQPDPDEAQLWEDEPESDDEDDEPNLEPDDDTSESDSDASNGCTGNTIQTLDIGELMGKCRILITTIRKSGILHEALRAIAHEYSINVDLILDMRVRWNSSYNMISRLLVFQPAVEGLYVQMDDLPGVTKRQREKLMDAHLSNSEWILLQSLRFVLERFSDATEIISGKSYPTMSVVYAVKLSLHHFLNEFTDDTNVRIIKQMLLLEFERYMKLPVTAKEAEIINAAALLDPATHDVVKHQDKKTAEKFLINEAKRRMKDNSAEQRNLRTSTAVDAEELGRSDSLSVVKGGAQIKKFFNKCGLSCSTKNTGVKKALTIQQELARLASIPKDGYDCVTFWQEHGNTMPSLAVLARKFLATSATSVPSESAFSISNYVLRKNRLALSSKNVKYTMFLKDKLN